MTAQPSPLPATSARPASGAVVNIRALRHSFGAVDALKAVDVSIEPGEFVALGLPKRSRTAGPKG